MFQLFQLFQNLKIISGLFLSGAVFLAAVPLAANDYSCYVTIQNYSGGNLTLMSTDLSWGHWGSNGQPPGNIPSQSTVKIQVSDDGSWTSGTEATVVYLDYTGAQITFYFDCPYWGTSENQGSIKCVDGPNKPGVCAGYSLNMYAASGNDNWSTTISQSGNPCYFWFGVSTITGGSVAEPSNPPSSSR